MKILLGTLIGIAVLSAIMAAIAFFLPSTYLVERTALINAPSSRVFSEVGDLRNWQHWTPWMKSEEDLYFTFSDSTRFPGATAKWEAYGKGDGELQLREVSPEKRVSYITIFPAYGLASDGSIELTPKGNATEVHWVDKGDVGWSPVKRFFALFAVKMVEKDFDLGLANLKKVCETGQ